MKDSSTKRFWLMTVFGVVLALSCLLLRIIPNEFSYLYSDDSSRHMRVAIILDTLILTGCFFVLIAFVDRFIKGAWSKYVPKGIWFVVVIGIIFLMMRFWMLFQSHRLAGALGFPIDDAWIHFTFAKNIAQGFDMSFNPGELCTGSSSPLWTYMLAGGLLLGLTPTFVTFSLATVFSTIALILSYKLTLRLWNDELAAKVVVLLLALEHYTAWDNLSGMEISLYTSLILVILWLSFFKDWRWWIAMMLLGVALITRVEALFLAMAIFVWKLWVDRGRSWYLVLIGGLIALVVASPMMLKYLSIGGQILPQTYTAKAAPLNFQTIEVALLCTLAFLSFPTILAFSLGVIPAIVGFVKTKPSRRGFLPIIFFLVIGYVAYTIKMGFMGSYYRYLHPFIPLLAILIVGGIAALQGEWRRIALTVMVFMMTCAAVLSAPLYGWSVENIQSQQITMSKWAAINIPIGEKIAVNDVGAMGFFSQHYLVDLLGLVGDPKRVSRQYVATVDELLRDDIHYLIIYPEWFPILRADERVHEIACFSIKTPTTAGFKTAYVYKIIPKKMK